MLSLILDYREKSLFLTCQKLLLIEPKFNIVIKSENLELGDAIIRSESGENLVYFERKSIPDLLSSIKDGRYNEQSFRLNSLPIPNHNIIFLIEGTVISKFEKDKMMIFSSMFSILYYKGFTIHRSTSMDETAYIICNAVYKIAKEQKNNKLPFYSSVVNTNDIQKNTEYCSLVKTKKNANISKENFGEIVLCNIPSVSSVSAVAIMKEYKTINNLINKLRNDPTILNNFTYDSKKTKRKISKTVIQNIIHFLLQDCDEDINSEIDVRCEESDETVCQFRIEFVDNEDEI